MVLKRFKHAYTNYEKERVRYPIKRGGYPIKRVRYPIKRGGYPIKRGRYPIKRGRYPINPFNSATFICLFLTNSFSLRAAAASCRFIYDVWNSPYTRPLFTLPPKGYFNNDSSLLEGLWPQTLVSFKKYMTLLFSKEEEDAYMFWMKQVPVIVTLKWEKQ